MNRLADKMPCAFDARPLRITLFPEHPQTILIYVPEGSSLWLPTLPTPFDLDTVSDALDAHDVPHDTKEGDRNRWWRNLKQSENEDKALTGQQQRENEAVRRVKIHLSTEAETLEKQRAEILEIKYKVDAEIRDLKAQVGQAKTIAVTRGVYEDPVVFRRREKHIADLQTTSIAAQKKLGELKEALKEANRRASSSPRDQGRERRFIEKAKRHLTRAQYLAIWAEVESEEAAV